MRILVVGNCQARGLADCLKAMAPQVDVQSAHITVQAVPDGPWDVLLLQTELRHLTAPGGLLRGIDVGRILTWPTFYFPGYHPDIVYAYVGDQTIQNPVGFYNSSIILHGYLRGFDADRIEALFCEDVFRRLGFFDYWSVARRATLDDLASCDLDTAAMFDRWAAEGCFAHTVNHPKLRVLGTIAGAVLDALGIAPVTRRPEEFLDDQLKESTVWPVYPGLARALGLEGSYEFKVSRHLCTADLPVRVLGLRAYISECLHWYSHYPRDDIRCDRLADRSALYAEALDDPPRGARSGPNPYRSLPEHHFWKRAVASPDWRAVDPVVATKFKLDRGDRVATAGSCFAQHIARTLARTRVGHYVAETDPTVSTAAGSTAGSPFSARYGNIYTARQLAQLLDRASGRFVPSDEAWVREDGRFVDPFRPSIQPDGFPSAQAVAVDRERHLGAVRRLFGTVDVFVFTVGLTEAWRARSDGAVFPVAPGVTASGHDGSGYEFVNFGVEETRRDLRSAIDSMRAFNPAIRIILTVSPVPLVATFEPRHVLVSTAYSKSVLRAAVGEVAAEDGLVDYFPSYEIITGPHVRGRYLKPDLREVEPSGVERVMDVFLKHFVMDADRPAEADPGSLPPGGLASEISRGARIVCDEEALDDVSGTPMTHHRA